MIHPHFFALLRWLWQWLLRRTGYCRPIVLVVTLALLHGGCGVRPVSTLKYPEAAVVRINSFSNDGADLAEGCGFFVSADGLIVTCLHVIDGSKKIIVAQSDGKILHAEFVEEDRDADVVILRVPVVKVNDKPQDFPFLRLLDGDFDPGTHVRVAGVNGVTHGLFDHWENFGRDIQFTNAILPADSGAPLIAENGLVIGVVRGLSHDPMVKNLATPAWHVIRMMPQLGGSRGN